MFPRIVTLFQSHKRLEGPAVLTDLPTLTATPKTAPHSLRATLCTCVSTVCFQLCVRMYTCACIRGQMACAITTHLIGSVFIGVAIGARPVASKPAALGSQESAHGHAWLFNVPADPRICTANAVPKPLSPSQSPCYLFLPVQACRPRALPVYTGTHPPEWFARTGGFSMPSTPTPDSPAV